MRYWLFEAAYAGCLPCAVRFLEQDGVSSDIVSCSAGYSAMDWALWGQTEGREQCAAVVSYFRARYPTMPCRPEVPTGQNRQKKGRSGTTEEALNRARGNQTPVAGGVGERIMLNAGWQPGLPIGASQAKDALLTPLLTPEPPRGRPGLRSLSL